MTRKNNFFEGCARFKFDNLGLALSIPLKFYIIVTKGLKLKVTNFGGLYPMSVEVTGKKIGKASLFVFPPILNTVKTSTYIYFKIEIMRKVLNLKLFIKWEYQNIRTFLYKAILEISQTKILWSKKIKALHLGYM